MNRNVTLESEDLQDNSAMEETRTERSDVERESLRSRLHTDCSTSTTCLSEKISSHFDRIAPPLMSTIKEEPLPNKDKNFKGATISTASRRLRPYTTGEEPPAFQEDIIPTSGHSTDVKHDLPNPHNSTLTAHRQHILTCIKEEPISDEEDLLHPQTSHIKVEPFSVDRDCCSLPVVGFPSVQIKQEGRRRHSNYSAAHLDFLPVEIKEEPLSPDMEFPTNVDISPSADHEQCLSMQIKDEDEEDFPHGEIHILEGTITDSDIHSFTITGEYIEGIEIKLKTKPMQDMAASTSQLTSSKTTYTCPVCKRSFSNHGNLVRHRETHKGKKMSCTECGADFCNKMDLTAHCRVHKANRVLYCPECNITFPSNSHLVIHERIHTGEKPFPCARCGKRFSSKSNVAEHMKVHTGSKQFCCSACGKSYARRENLLSHQRIHQEAVTYKCAHCGQCFVDEHKFHRHQRFHTLDKPYPCVLCGKRFAHKALLLRHERTHVGGSPACSECGKSFFRQAELTKHRRAHATGEKHFGCAECGKLFSSGPRLANHQKLHAADKAYECSVCGNCFKQKNNLVRHRRVHQVEKPFWCAECERGFTTRSNLKVHRRVHIMRRQHPCPHCGKEFPFKSRLNEHLKVHEEHKTDEEGQS